MTSERECVLREKLELGLREKNWPEALRRIHEALELLAAAPPEPGEPPSRWAVLHELWNGEIKLSAEERRWIRQALDVQERGAPDALAAVPPEEPSWDVLDRNLRGAYEKAVADCVNCRALNRMGRVCSHHQPLFNAIAAAATAVAARGAPEDVQGPWRLAQPNRELGTFGVEKDPAGRRNYEAWYHGSFATEAEAIAVRDALNRVAKGGTDVVR